MLKNCKINQSNQVNVGSKPWSAIKKGFWVNPLDEIAEGNLETVASFWLDMIHSFKKEEIKLYQKWPRLDLFLEFCVCNGGMESPAALVYVNPSRNRGVTIPSYGLSSVFIVPPEVAQFIATYDSIISNNNGNIKTEISHGMRLVPKDDFSYVNDQLNLIRSFLIDDPPPYALDLPLPVKKHLYRIKRLYVALLNPTEARWKAIPYTITTQPPEKQRKQLKKWRKKRKKLLKSLLVPRNKTKTRLPPPRNCHGT